MLRTLTALAGVLLAPIVAAQEMFPSRPVTMVVPFPPGGVADLTARPVAAASRSCAVERVGPG